MSEISQIVRDVGAYLCLECGKCSAVCPITQYNPDFSPRKVVYSALYEPEAELLKNENLWSCITCARCEEICQSGVRYTELIRSLRERAYHLDNKGQYAHGGALQSLMHILASDNISQNRLGWRHEGLKTASEGDILYFTGCQPYFDALFPDLGLKMLDIPKSAVKLLNRLSIVPALLENERCCGHDLLGAGNTEHFYKLAQHNVEEMRKAGVSKVITSCAECYQTLKFEYPRYLGKMEFEVLHISEVLAGAVASDKLKLRRSTKKVTYHDPCRLGRYSGIYEEPRTVINAIPGLELVEMPRNRKSALCCGTQAWMNCGTINKQIQAERLQEAGDTGAEVMLTSCPKCQIHLKCAMNDGKLGKKLKIEIEDLTSFVARALSA